MNKRLVIILTIVALGLLSGGGYLLNNYIEDTKKEPLTQFYPLINHEALSNIQTANNVIKNFYRPEIYIQRCKRFPLNIRDMHNEEYANEEIGCRPYDASFQLNNTEYKITIETPWIDPWGRPYQIRYDLERAKLQLRSQGRYLWTEYDDIFEETYFDGKSYKEHVEYCKKVPKDDMTCIFNRGWH